MWENNTAQRSVKAENCRSRTLVSDYHVIKQLLFNSQSGIGLCNSWSHDQLSVNTRFVWEKLFPPSHIWVVFHKVLVNFEIFKLLFNPLPWRFYRKMCFEASRAVFWSLSCYKELKLTTKLFTGGTLCGLLIQRLNISLRSSGMHRKQNFKIVFGFKSDAAVLFWRTQHACSY